MACPNCNDKGYVSRPYMMGLKTGNLSTITICDCLAGQDYAAALQRSARRAAQDREG